MLDCFQVHFFLHYFTFLDYGKFFFMSLRWRCRFVFGCKAAYWKKKERNAVRPSHRRTGLNVNCFIFLLWILQLSCRNDEKGDKEKSRKVYSFFPSSFLPLVVTGLLYVLMTSRQLWYLEKTRPHSAERDCYTLTYQTRFNHHFFIFYYLVD